MILRKACRGAPELPLMSFKQIPGSANGAFEKQGFFVMTLKTRPQKLGSLEVCRALERGYNTMASPKIEYCGCSAIRPTGIRHSAMIVPCVSLKSQGDSRSLSN